MSEQSTPKILAGTSQASSSYANSRAKRVIDLSLALVVLLLSSPMLIPVTIINAFTTRGHPIFVQRRIGKDGTEFGLIKLRTMRMRRQGEQWSYRTELIDERLMLVGKILRRSYMDELPQLINVLLGHMSMIGPRPETLETTRKISETNPRFRDRMAVKPGITGAAQIYFRKPESDHDLWRRYYYDRFYIAQSSFWFDLKITMLTIWHIIRHKGH